MTELHTTTWLLKRMRQMKSALQECESYFEELASYEWLEDGPSGNREAQLLEEVRTAIAAGSGTAETVQQGSVRSKPERNRPDYPLTSPL